MERKTEVSIGVAFVLLVAAVLVSAVAGNQPPYYPGPWATQGFPAQSAPGQGTWVLVAYDYNGDGQVDAYQYIYSTDLNRAIEASQQRPDGAERTMVRQYYGPSSQGSPAAQYRPARPYAAPGEQMRQTTGTVRDIRQVRLAQHDQVHFFAKVQAPQGDLTMVDLGPVNQLRQLNIKTATTVQVNGDMAMVNGRPVLMASQVSVGGRTVNVDMPPGSRTRRLQGQITNVAVKRLEGSGQPAHVVAMLRLTPGQTVPVDLGRQDDLRDVRLRTGDTIVVLARPVPIGNKMIFVARQFSVGGKVIDEPWLSQFTGRRQQQARAR
jgi:hypothetical protein